MGRKREISSEQATVLAGLGHIIHYSYDPSEVVGRPSSKAVTKRIRRKRRVKQAPNRIELTTRLPNKTYRKNRPSAAKVYDAARKIIGTTRLLRHAMGRPTLCKMVAKQLDKTERAVQTQISILIGSGHLKQFKDAST